MTAPPKKWTQPHCPHTWQHRAFKFQTTFVNWGGNNGVSSLNMHFFYDWQTRVFFHVSALWIVHTNCPASCAFPMEHFQRWSRAVFEFWRCMSHELKFSQLHKYLLWCWKQPSKCPSPCALEGHSMKSSCFSRIEFKLLSQGGQRDWHRESSQLHLPTPWPSPILPFTPWL